MICHSKKVLRNAQGFTLIELLIVVTIIALLAGLVVPQFIKQEEKATAKAAKAQIELLGTALDTFRLDVGRYPSSQEGLAALNQKPGGVDRWDGPYLKKEVPTGSLGQALHLQEPRRPWPVRYHFLRCRRRAGRRRQ